MSDSIHTSDIATSVDTHHGVETGSDVVADEVGHTKHKATEALHHSDDHDVLGGTEAKDTPKKHAKTPSKLMTSLKKGVNQMTDPLTRPVKNTISSVRSRTMGLLDRLKAGEHLSKKEILAILVVIPGASLLLGAHYANLFSKKAQAAIEAGKVKWEKFLHSLGLSKGATVHDIHHAEEHVAQSAPHAPEHPTVTDPVGEVGHVGAGHAPVANDDHIGTGHVDTPEHPEQEKKAA